MNDLLSLHVLNDRLLMQPYILDEKSKSGLILPTSYGPMSSAKVLKTGKGYPIVDKDKDTPVYMKKDENIISFSYAPLSVQINDIIIYKDVDGIDITYKGINYVIIEESAAILIIRDDLVEKLISEL